MAKITFNPLVMNIRGKVGNAVLRLCHTGETQFARVPNMSRVKWSKAQKEHRLKVKDAVIYAQMAMRNPEFKAYYLEMAAKRNSRRPFDMAVSDYFKGEDTENSLLKIFRHPNRAYGDCIRITEKLHIGPTKPVVPADDFCI